MLRIRKNKDTLHVKGTSTDGKRRYIGPWIWNNPDTIRSVHIVPWYLTVGKVGKVFPGRYRKLVFGPQNGRVSRNKGTY